MTTHSESSVTSRPDADYVALDPVAYVHALWRHKLSLVAAPFLLAAAFYGLSYTQPKSYQSVVRFMPPKPIGGGLLMLARSVNSGDEYRAELNSRTVGLDVVHRLHLVERLKLKDEETALRVADGMSKFATDVNAFVTITVTSGDPQLSADVANGFFASLNRFGEALSEHESEHRLNYMAGPLKVEQQRLQAAEEALEEVQSRTGLVVPGAQASLGLQQVASIRARVSELETALATARLRGTDQNPQVVALQSQLSNLQGQIRMLEGKNQQANSPSNLPKLSLEVLRREREVAFHTATLEALTKSLGTAQATDSYTPSLSLVDGAFPAKEKFAPRRKQWALAGFAMGLVLALIRVLLGAAVTEWKQSATGQGTLQRWTQSWRRRSSAGHA